MAEGLKLNKTMTTILLFVVGQAIAGLIWGATMTMNVRHMSEQINELKREVASDAAKDSAALLRLIETNERRIAELENAVWRRRSALEP